MSTRSEVGAGATGRWTRVNRQVHSDEIKRRRSYGWRNTQWQSEEAKDANNNVDLFKKISSI